jgi:hypothetical protein
LIEYYENNTVQLFNLKMDPGEQHDLSRSEPGKVQELSAMLHDWRKNVNAERPAPNPNYDPNKNWPAGEIKDEPESWDWTGSRRLSTKSFTFARQLAFLCSFMTNTNLAYWGMAVVPIGVALCFGPALLVWLRDELRASAAEKKKQDVKR